MKRILAGLALGLAVLVALVIAAAIEVSSYPIETLRHRAPRRTALMKQRAAEARARGGSFEVDQRWVSYGSVAPLLRHAILIAEDDGFYLHGGLDWNEIQAAARKNLEKRRVVRGGSTITQQLAKNLYLGDARTPTRKFKEMFLAMRLERALSKRRIFELYLNLIEWGNGIFGVEAAARHYFGISAADLDERQCVLLAAVIINPRRFSPLHPTPRIDRRARMIASRLRRRGYLTEAEYRVAIGAEPPSRGFFDWLFGKESHPYIPPPDTSDSTPEPDTAVPETDTVAVPDSSAAPFPE